MIPDLSLISAVASSAVLGAITVGLTSVFGRWVDGRFMPLVALVVGVGLTLTVIGVSWLAFWGGIALGLVSMGLYDVGAKAILGR